MLLFIDNYDSFTYNLVQCFQMLGLETQVIRGQTKTVQECLHLTPRYVVIGPGPGSPSEAILSKGLITACAGNLPLLGVCLGHQALAECYGGTVIKAKIPIHGKTSEMFHTNQGIFQGLPQGFSATRYHSLIVAEEKLPECLTVTAKAETGEVMGLRHHTHALESVQFHPESILTEHGMTLLRNFLNNYS